MTSGEGKVKSREEMGVHVFSWRATLGLLLVLAACAAAVGGGWSWNGAQWLWTPDVPALPVGR
jgi:hypothetical protein